MDKVILILSVIAEFIYIILLFRNPEKNLKISSKFLSITYEIFNATFILYVFFILLTTQQYIKFEINSFNAILLVAFAMQFVVMFSIEKLRKNETILNNTIRNSLFKKGLLLLFIVSIVVKLTILNRIS